MLNSLFRMLLGKPRGKKNGWLAAAACGLMWAGCADGAIVTQDPPDAGPVDDAGRPIGDGGRPEPLWYGAAVEVVLPSGNSASGTDAWRNWKRDPQLLVDSGDQYLFFAGSPTPDVRPEQWTLGWARVPVGMSFRSGPTYQQIAVGQAGAWDSLDLLAPAAVPPKTVGGAWTLFYAGRGGVQPEYVTQIGAMTSTDRVHWTRAQAGPVVPAPLVPGVPGGYGATDPSVVTIGGQTFLFYAGLTCDAAACKYQILRAPVTGVQVGAAEAVLSGETAAEAGGVTGPSVVAYAGRYYMAYTALKSAPPKSWAQLQQVLLAGTVQIAVSDDGKRFVRVSSGAGLAAATASVNSEGSAAPALYVDGTLRLLFGGYTKEPAYSIATSVIASK